MADTASDPSFGNITQAQLAAIGEMFALFTNVNAAGIPDLIETTDVNVNAVFGRYLYNFIMTVNGYFNGEITPLPPGLVGVATTASDWRLHDDFSQHPGPSDFAPYGIPVPDLVYPCNGVRTSQAGGLTLINDASAPNQRGVYHVTNSRGGVSDSHFGVVTRALRSHQALHYWSDANDSIGDANTACAFVMTMTEWPQHNERVVLMSQRRFDGSDETGASFRLGWELALAPGPTGDFKDRIFEFRDMDSGDSPRTVQLGSAPEFDTLPLGGDMHIAFVRHADAPNQRVKLYINGILLQDTGVTGVALPGTDPDMRLVVGSQYDGSKNSNAAFRDICVWKATGAGLPTDGQITSHHRMTAGFLSILPPPP